VQRFLNRVKHCRRLATRFGKVQIGYLGLVLLADFLSLVA
jgi:hypothetical protein